MTNNPDNKATSSLQPALGLIFGTAAGGALGIILSQNMAIFAGIGAALGLIVGAIINLQSKNG